MLVMGRPLVRRKVPRAPIPPHGNAARSSDHVCLVVGEETVALAVIVSLRFARWCTKEAPEMGLSGSDAHQASSPP